LAAARLRLHQAQQYQQELRSAVRSTSAAAARLEGGGGSSESGEGPALDSPASPDPWIEAAWAVSYVEEDGDPEE